MTLMSVERGGPKCMGCMYDESVCFFLLPKFSQKFDLKNMILTDTKDFSWGKMVLIRQI